MDLVETGVKQGNDERDPAADGGPFVARRFDRQCGGEQEARSAEQEIEKNVRELADVEAEDDGHSGSRHPGRDLDA